jgi:hypothetical protein
MLLLAWIIILSFASWARVEAEVSVKTQLRNLVSYQDLASCSQLCIAGKLSLDPAEWHSVAALTGCHTKACFCNDDERSWLETNLWDCMQPYTDSCGSPGFEHSYNVALEFIADWCGFTPVLKVQSARVHI